MNTKIKKIDDRILTIYNVLVVAFISDMDKRNTSEQIHAIPIAYGKSVYSLKVNSLRGMPQELGRVFHR